MSELNIIDKTTADYQTFIKISSPSVPSIVFQNWLIDNSTLGNSFKLTDFLGSAVIGSVNIEGITVTN